MVQRIQTALLGANTFVDLLPLVKEAKEDVTFFGHRYIYIKGYNGTLSIDALALRVMQLLVVGDLTNDQNERKAFDEAVPLISHLYKESVKRMRNPLTFLLINIRASYQHYSLWGYDTRFCWDYVVDWDYDKSEWREFPSDLIPLLTREPIQPVLGETSTFKDLLPIAQKATADISFFGGRFVRVEEYEGTLPIHALAQRVMEVAKNTLDYHKDADYQSILPLVDHIYEENEKHRQEKKLLTRLFCAIRDSSGAFSKCEAQWEQHKKTG